MDIIKRDTAQTEYNIQPRCANAMTRAKSKPRSPDQKIPKITKGAKFTDEIAQKDPKATRKQKGLLNF